MAPIQDQEVEGERDIKQDQRKSSQENCKKKKRKEKKRLTHEFLQIHTLVVDTIPQQKKRSPVDT